MNRTRRFFLYAWRFNAVVILLIGLGALSLIGLALAEEVGDLFRADDSASSRIIAGNDSSIEADLLTQFEPIPNSPVLRAQLGKDSSSDSFSSFKHSQGVRDYLFVDTVSHQSWWLRGQAPGLILQTMELNSNGDTTELPAKAPEAVLYLIVSRDSNSDKRLDSEDETVLAISDAEGRRFKTLMQFSGEINTASLAHDSPRHAVLLYTSKGGLRLARISLDKQSIEQDAPLSSSQKSN